MAATAELLVLVALAVRCIRSESHLSTEGQFVFFNIDAKAYSCLISRVGGNERKLVWNSSDVRADPSVVRARKPYLDGTVEDVAAYKMDNLNHSDSGLYQSQCATQGNVTFEKNSSLFVCDWQAGGRKVVRKRIGETLELSCDGASSGLSVLWFSWSSLMDYWERVDETSDKLEVVKKNSILIADLKQPGHLEYVCLTTEEHRCVFLQNYVVAVLPEFVFRSVGESLEVNCSETVPQHPFVWRWSNVVEDDGASRNYTLMFPSLTLNHSGLYSCGSKRVEAATFALMVCPEFDPPAVVFVTGGENVTLLCGDDREPPGETLWFMKTNKTGGGVTYMSEHIQSPAGYDLDMKNLLIFNVSLEDIGEYWCAISVQNHCTFSFKTLVIYGDPALVNHTARSVVFCFSVTVMLVAAVVVTCRTRSGTQSPVYVNQLEMANLS